MRHLLFLSAFLFGVGPLSAADLERPKEKRPQVEVVFCLDTTGSMSGLLEGAKQKIWSIVNQIVSGQPAPDVKVGLVGYRDRKDEYVTKMTDLTSDLDEIHKQLRGFQAGGGGDTPESVNQALNESVTKFKWTPGNDTLRIIFLVGDAPPHMDYADDVKYPETCKLAVEKGIIINTVQCGSEGEAQKHWQEICSKANGTYNQIAQNGGVQTVQTPFDKELAELNVRFLRTNCCYGADKMAGEMKNSTALALPASGGVAADSVGFRAKAGRIAANDLLDDLQEGKIKLESIPDKDLPEALQKMKPDERKKHVEKLKEERVDLKKKVLDLDKKRLDFIAKKQAEEAKEAGKTKDGFDSKILETLRKQAEKVHIKY
jgi:Mg-chelatase subunit ChlD